MLHIAVFHEVLHCFLNKINLHGLKYMHLHLEIQTCDRLLVTIPSLLNQTMLKSGPHNAVRNVSGFRYVSDCRSRGREFDPGAVPYFCVE